MKKLGKRKGKPKRKKKFKKKMKYIDDQLQIPLNFNEDYISDRSETDPE